MSDGRSIEYVGVPGIYGDVENGSRRGKDGRPGDTSVDTLANGPIRQVVEDRGVNDAGMFRIGRDRGDGPGQSRNILPGCSAIGGLEQAPSDRPGIDRLWSGGIHGE